MTHREQELPTIVCGDFNILEKPHITPLSWIFGGSVVDALLYRRERTTIEKHFVEHSLHNVLRGKVTHTISQSQLDHILVSDSLTVQNAKVISSKYGSDHHPIFVEITSRQRKQ
jgi:endonuclease/exonuclease/phosphatase family metal-dependent hydrolase